jgi:hypothetical protein
MGGDSGEREGYEEDHSDRDDYPEEVWEQMQLEKWEANNKDDELYEELDPEEDEPDTLDEFIKQQDAQAKQKGKGINNN